jgi:uncharacterized linocin/CFP29 family protein
MNGSLGRDKVWNQQIWSDIDKAVQEEVGRIRVAQKVFPSTVVNNVLPVCISRTVPFGPKSAPPEDPAPVDDEFRPFFEISRDFVLTKAQVDGEEDAHLAPSFARLAASVMANAEDRILFLGAGGIPAAVKVANRPAIPPGFVKEADNYKPFTLVEDSSDDDLGEILTAVSDGMAKLQERDQPGPYALFLPPYRYAQAFEQPEPGLLQTPGDQIPHVVTGGFYMVNSLAIDKSKKLPNPPTNDNGILVSLGGEPTKIILGADAMTAFTFADEKGNYHFRVFERIQMVVRDGRAFQILEFNL